MKKNALKKTDRIFVAGHRGLVGRSLVDSLKESGFDNLILATRDELDLLNTEDVRRFFAQTKPDVVFLAAAKVGGIVANNEFRADFIYENMQIQSNVIWSAHNFDVRRLIFLGSSCIYPRLCTQPMHETSLMTGPLEYTNRPYAIAKIAGLELVHSLRVQYNRDFFSVMPTNLFGPFDNFHPTQSHVIPALIRRFCEAKETNAPEITVWGSGLVKREFMPAAECAHAIVHLAQLESDFIFRDVDSAFSHINIGTGEELTIADLARMIADIISYRGNIIFDRSKPDGTPRKLLNTDALRASGWEPTRTFQNSLEETISWYQVNRDASMRR